MNAEYDAFDNILEHQSDITGIVLEIHFNNADSASRALKLLSDLDKHFLLLHVHGNSYAIDSGFFTSNSIGRIPNVLELTYINKSLVTKYHVSENQSHPTLMDMSNMLNGPEAQFTILP